MIGTKLFQFVFSNLGEECRRKILRNIFEIQDVSIADISFREGKVIFRFLVMMSFISLYLFLVIVIINLFLFYEIF